MRNILCDSADLHNEADVEHLFINPLLRKLGYPDSRVRRRAAIEDLALPTTGSRPEIYRPDFVLIDSAGRPAVVVDAKHPSENPSRYRYQVTGYALLINQRYGDNPVSYCVLSNGHKTELLRWDQQAPLLTLRFEDFDLGSTVFAEMRSAVSFNAVSRTETIQEVRPGYRRPTIEEIIRCFATAHNMIWKKEKCSPTKAFYELAKMLFVKLRQDRLVHARIDCREVPTTKDFYFTCDWIDAQPTANPVSDTLFKDIQQGLEEDITAGIKKRIFGRDEGIDMAAATVREVVKLLEGYDLHGIDEDLNGRMFETFLNATVRGRDLGQYFTPRPIVKYMTRSSQLTVSKGRLPRVLDGCCGSGGFLIEAMANLAENIQSSSQLTTTDQERLLSVLQTDALWGIDANDEIGRIARLNMYLHGDGGSRIYIADALDKELQVDAGLSSERRSQLTELQREIVQQSKLFDVVVTNPPFSMRYSRNDSAERRILERYTIAEGRATTASNVLFLERYLDLLEDDGELLTIIDDTVLNGTNSYDFRRFILDNFIIRQVVSLPFNAFFRAEANIKTSILHLRRKRTGERQGDVFMAIANNVGHDDHKRDTPLRDNLSEIANLFSDWDSHGILPQFLRPDNSGEPLGCPMQVFLVSAKNLSDRRLDAFYYSPELRDCRERIRAAVGRGTIEIRTGADFEIVKPLSGSERTAMLDEVRRYIEITSVTIDGQIISPHKDLVRDLPTRAVLPLRENDVLFAKNISSRGTAVLIPDWLAGGLGSSGYIAVRPESLDDALILWSIFRSEAWRTQVYYLAITASQPEVREEIFTKEMLIPWPVDSENRRRIIDSARQMLMARDTLRKYTGQNQETADALINGELP